MAFPFFFAMCSFPTTFQDLWHVAAGCGVILIITTGVVFWRTRSLKSPMSLLLMAGMLFGATWSCALAVNTSRNELVCAGIPGASAELIRQAEASSHTLQVFIAMVGATALGTVALVLLSVLNLYFISQRR